MAQMLCPILVSRLDETAALDAALHRLQSGHGSFVSVSGSAGIGKSRLLRELVERSRRLGFVVVTGRAVPPTVVAPYRPIVEALLQLLRDRHAPTDRELPDWIHHLAGILPGVLDEGPAPDADQQSSLTLRAEALLQLLRRSAASGAVMVLEDLHWADPETLAIVEYLADHVADEALVVAITIRSETPSTALALDRRLRARPNVIRLELGQLDRAATDEMIDACGGAPTESRRAWIRDVSEGVPLLVEDLLSSPGLPCSITESVLERVEELDDDERTAIQIAAVLGHHFDWDLLVATTGLPSELLAARLTRAVELLLVTTDGDEVCFRHAVTREAVLTTMLPPRRRTHAAALLAALDASGRNQDGKLREMTADLAEQAGELERAGALLLGSGQAAVHLGALDTGIDALHRALGLLSEPADRRSAQLSLLEALALAGRVDEAVEMGRALLIHLDGDPSKVQMRTEIHLRLAEAAAAATRWKMAKEHLREVPADGISNPVAVAGEVAVLSAQIASRRMMSRWRDGVPRPLSTSTGSNPRCGVERSRWSAAASD